MCRATGGLRRRRSGSRAFGRAGSGLGPSGVEWSGVEWSGVGQLFYEYFDVRIGSDVHCIHTYIHEHVSAMAMGVW